MDLSFGNYGGFRSNNIDSSNVYSNVPISRAKGSRSINEEILVICSHHQASGSSDLIGTYSHSTTSLCDNITYSTNLLPAEPSSTNLSTLIEPLAYNITSVDLPLPNVAQLIQPDQNATIEGHLHHQGEDNGKLDEDTQFTLSTVVIPTTGIGLYVLSLLTFVGNAMVLHAIRTDKRLQTVRKHKIL